MRTTSAHILENYIKHVKNKIVSDFIALDEWDSWTGIHDEPGHFVMDKNEYETMKTGDRWNAGYDSTRWFSSDIVIPEKFNNKKLYLFLDFGGEALVRLNGKIIGAISNEAGWVCRDVIPLSDIICNEKYKLEIEATVNCGVFCEKAIAGEKYLTYTIKSGKIAQIDEKTEQLYYDLITAFESLSQIDDKVIYDRIYKAIDESVHTIDFDFDDDAFYKSVPKAREVFSQLMDSIPDAKQGELCMIGHSHLDVAWLWTTRELVRKTARTFSNNTALMKQYPDFKFTQSQAIVYDYMKKYYPDIFSQVKEMVKAGQWEIVGNTWVEADTNLASGESLVRQLLYGREFFLKEFGVSSDIYWLPDCFGFTWAMPQIIKRSGMKYFCTAKLMYNATNKFPYSVFNWKSHSGDEIIACVQQGHYESEYDADYIKKCWERSNQKDITSKAIGAFGYGDGGGGCTYDMVERSKRFEKMPGMPKAKNTFVRDFFDGIENFSDELPTFNDEMYYENHRGTFSSQAFIKKNNRRGEFLLRNTEFAGVLADSIFGSEYQLDKIEECWKLLLTNQFHDTLPGTSIHDAVEMTRNDYKQLQKNGNGLLQSSMQVINKNISTTSECVIVWNFNSMPVTGSVSMEKGGDYSVKSADGKKCKTSYNNGLLEFIAENVSPMGYSVYYFDKSKVNSESVIATENLLENSKLKVVFDNNGMIDSIFDKVNEREILTDKGNRLTIFQDKPVYESAWNLELDYQKKFWNLDKADSIEVIESSATKGVLRIIRTFNKSRIEQDIILYADADYIDFDTRTQWYETEKVLKASFPVSVTNTNASYEIAHGSIDRPTHWNYITDMVRFEVCGHKWADLSEGDYGVSLINDCKYGYDIKDNNMRITLMRAPVCPDPTGDKGENSFKYRLYPHKGTWSQADTVKNAFEFNQPLKAYVSEKHSGILDENNSFITVDAANVIIDAIKKAQNDDGIILRVYEACKKRGKVGIKFNFGNVSKVIECNLMETDENEIDVENNKFEFFITPHQVRTFRIIF